MGILHLKWLLMFMRVLLVPISDEHKDLLHIPKLTVFRIVLLSYLIFLQLPCACKFNLCDFH